MNQSTIKRRIISTSIYLLVFICGAFCYRCYVKYKNELVESDKFADSTTIFEIGTATELDFTCTGLCFNDNDSTWLIGNFGNITPKETDGRPSIEIYTKDFQHLSSIPVGKIFPKMKDIQGVAYSPKDSTIWFCSFDEGIVRKIDMSAHLIDSLLIPQPTGIALNESGNELYILTPKELINFKSEGGGLSHINIPGQDALSYSNGVLYMTSGLDYQNDQYVHVIDPKSLRIVEQYKMHGSDAIEGIAFVDSTIYIANDGIYHQSKSAKNRILKYNKFHLR